MGTRDLLSIPLDDYANYAVSKVASDEYSCDEPFHSVFFFGKLINDNCFVEEVINERKYYTYCLHCGKLIMLDKKPNDGDSYECPHCCTSGTLYDYRDPNSSVGDDSVLYYAWLERLDKGFVLRLFETALDYSYRDYDNYTTLDCYIDMTLEEVGREYWYEGKVKYFALINDGKRAFKEVPRIRDRDYVIINWDNDFDFEYSELIADILYNHPYAESFIETISMSGSYTAFATLNKYGFTPLLDDFVYVPGFFYDSNKISKVLGLDYNKVISVYKASEIDAHDILAMRELQRYKLTISEKNVRIMHVLFKADPSVFNSDNVKKTFKYLRNQWSKSNKDVVRDYVDYLSDCRKLGLDTERGDIRYPTDLAKAHIRINSLVNLEANRETNKRIRAVYDCFSALCEFSDGEYCIVMPSSCEEIIYEGKVQSHCVGGYAERMAKGEDIILFLREVNKPNVPFYTVEIRPIMKKLDLVQCRGYKNEDKDHLVRAKVDEFLKKYEAWFNNRKVSFKDNTRKLYYKAVCKSDDGRYISHWDNKTEYRIGDIIETPMDSNPDLTAVSGIHIASLEFAKNYGDNWKNAAILEIEVDMRDVVIPYAKDQLRTKRGKVLREVPMAELGDWGARHCVV